MQAVYTSSTKMVHGRNVYSEVQIMHCPQPFSQMDCGRIEGDGGAPKCFIKYFCQLCFIVFITVGPLGIVSCLWGPASNIRLNLP